MSVSVIKNKHTMRFKHTMIIFKNIEENIDEFIFYLEKKNEQQHLIITKLEVKKEMKRK